MLDRDDLLSAQPAAHPDEDRCAGLLPVAAENGALGQYQMHPRLADIGNGPDGSRQLTLQGAQAIDVLNEIGTAEAVCAVEDLVSE